MGGRKWTIRTTVTWGRRGFTLLELSVVMAIIVILAAIAIPALSGLTRVSAEGAARTALRSLFASARSRAAEKQAYTGIRFQQDKNGRSYAIMLDYMEAGAKASADFPNGCPLYNLTGTDPSTGPFLTFVAADTEPILLPRNVEFAAGDRLASAANPDALALWQPQAAAATDATAIVPAITFDVIFSPAGQIVRKYVHVTQRRDRWEYEDTTPLYRTWSDPVFNLAGVGLFPPDVEDKGTAVTRPPTSTSDTDPDPQGEPGKPTIGLKQDDPLKTSNRDAAVSRLSQGSIWVYERDKRLEHTGFDVATCHPFTQYIQTSGSLIQLNVYTGAPVNTQQ